MATRFNADYYVTIATIVPIFLLALSYSALRSLGTDGLVKRARAAAAAGRRSRLWIGVLAVVFGLPALVGMTLEFVVLAAIRSQYNLDQVEGAIVTFLLDLFIVFVVLGGVLTGLDAYMKEVDA